MEVHKHPHHVTHAKKWFEYLLEFLMLFLAVYLGFVAENIRENNAERHREKEYIVSLIRDLRTDTANLSKVINSFANQNLQQDSLMIALDLIETGNNEIFMRNLNSITGFSDFIYTDATIQQLKSSGGFRLIQNKMAVDSINIYTSAVNRTYINIDDLNKVWHEMGNMLFVFLNFHNLNTNITNDILVNDMQKSNIDILISHDKKGRDLFYNKIFQFRRMMNIVRYANFVPLKKQASNLITFLTKEYHLENQ